MQINIHCILMSLVVSYGTLRAFFKRSGRLKISTNAGSRMSDRTFYRGLENGCRCLRDISRWWSWRLRPALVQEDDGVCLIRRQSTWVTVSASADGSLAWWLAGPGCGCRMRRETGCFAHPTYPLSRSCTIINIACRMVTIDLRAYPWRSRCTKDNHFNIL